MSSAKAQAQSSAKRMQLSRDQKALLETVYAMEKLPDAAPEGRRERWAPADAGRRGRVAPLATAAGRSGWDAERPCSRVTAVERRSLRCSS